MSGYIGNIPTPQATQTRDTFTATAGQTTFATSGYTPSFLDVFLNGVHLVNGTDYTASNGSDVVLTSGAAAGDIVEVVAYSTFQLADQTFTGDFSVDSPTFVVDSTNNRVGVGTASPSANLEIDAGAASGTHLQITTSATGHNFYMTDSGGTARIRNANGVLRIDADLNNEAVDSRIQFEVDGTERMRLDNTGDLNLLTGQLLMAGNTTYQILNVYYGADNTTYSTSSTNDTLGGVMSTSTGVSPTTSTSKLIVAWRARSNIRRTVSTGNDSRGELVLRWYDGTTYSGNNAANFMTRIGMVNTTGSGNSSHLYHYAVPVITTFLDQTYTRSDTGTWTLRLYGNCDYADNLLTTENVSWLLIEVDNGT